MVSLILLKRSLIIPILLFSSIFLHWSLMNAFLSLLVILQNSVFRWIYLSFSLLPFTSLLSSAICKASSDDHFAFLLFFLDMVLITTSSTMLWTLDHTSPGTLSDLESVNLHTARDITALSYPCLIYCFHYILTFLLPPLAWKHI